MVKGISAVSTMTPISQLNTTAAPAKICIAKMNVIARRM
ncbi:hypothetical protein PPIS_b1028 [Pseudoalteromonas piscicida]|uniref:Uncharacterized protein n=1 Tax=Pseudoalteromonas piscicida TaxID=43662 RepID=A0ABN5CP80_PSEO7|nr:hypothetical protein PPIS_b1028 [Pseudoalteromonas piscicida]